jgi:hypothetical protein
MSAPDHAGRGDADERLLRHSSKIKIQPKPGTLVYNRAGEKAKYATSSADGKVHYVHPAIMVPCYDEDGGDVETFEAVATWHEYFLSPPVAVLHDEVAALTKQIGELQAKTQKAREDQAAVEKEIRERKERVMAHDKLKMLDLFLQGKITHFVQVEYEHLSIIEVKEAKTRSGYSKEFRLLKLSMTVSWNKPDALDWKLSEYHDGSGSSPDCIPCCSYEEAVAEAAKLAQAYFSTALERGNYHSGLERMATFCVSHKIPVPEPITAWIKETALAQAEKSVADCERNLLLNKQKLDRLKQP